MPELQVDRLVSFLGKPRQGRYDITTYLHPHGLGDACETEFVAEALCRFFQPREVIVLATKQAWETRSQGLAQGEELQERLESLGCETKWRELPLGRDTTELWEQFEILRSALCDELDGTTPRVALDVTHGFRSQPFFAAGVITFVQLVEESPPEISVYYGAFEARQDNGTPIWDLTVFSDLISWSADIMLFLKTGRAAGVAKKTISIGKALRKEWATGGGREKGLPRPEVKELGKALQDFGNDLETVRTGSLLLGSRAKEPTAKELRDELDAARESVQEAIPPLGHVLERVHSMVEPLVTDERLSKAGGFRAVHALAKLYLAMGRYAEAASTLREAFVNMYADERCDWPGSEEFDLECRKEAEKKWLASGDRASGELPDLRNDIEHAGYRRHPARPATIVQKLGELTEHLRELLQS